MPTSQDIYVSRDNIRNQIVELTKQYLELENVDLTKSSFLSYLIEVLSTLSSNIMFYETNVYKEFFLTKAQLPESVHNLASFINYTPQDAQFSTANLLMSIPLTDNKGLKSFDPSGSTLIYIGASDKPFQFTSTDGIVFLTYYITEIEIIDSATANIIINLDGKLFNIRSQVITDDNTQILQFVLPVRQYETIRNQFAIEDLLEPYRFVSIDVPVTNKLAELEVWVIPPGGDSDNPAPEDEWLVSQDNAGNITNSLYTMAPTDQMYITRKSYEGRTITFGNGILGQQPIGGSTVIVDVKETKGSDGNVIANSIVNGQRIYTEVLSGVAEIVNYDVTNASPAFGGEDEESIQEVRSNAIANLTSLNRLVSEEDYINAGVVIPSSPLAANSIPVLKRSDIKVNEIQLFTTFNFAGELVPTRNARYDIVVTDTLIPRNTIITIDNIDYLTIFDMEYDNLNQEVYYSYSLETLELVPFLESTATGASVQDAYTFSATGVVVSRREVDLGGGLFDVKVDVILDYYSTEPDYDLAVCNMEVESGTGVTHSMTNDDLNNRFTLELDYSDLPIDDVKLRFIVTHPSVSEGIFKSEYSVNFIFRKSLRSYMISNAVVNANEIDVVVYDIPVIEQDWYNNLDSKPAFEAEVMQAFLTSIDMTNYRMLTDFVNIKLCNTTGNMRNMLLNETNIGDVLNLGLTSIPDTLYIADDLTNGIQYSIDRGHRFIATGYEGVPWDGEHNNIAKVRDDGIINDPMIDPIEWEFIDPVTNDISQVLEKGVKYIYTHSGWIVPNYTIPLQISLEVFRSSAAGTIAEQDLINTIKVAIMDAFQDRFGPNVTLHRSEIIDVVQSVDGVSYCRLLQPQSSIFFNFNIDNFTQQELLDYAPEWVFFTEENISIRVFTE